MRRRFFVDQFDGTTAALRGEAAHHLGRVLRAQKGQLYELSDGQAVWLARIEQVKEELVAFSLVEQLPAQASRLRITLALSIVKFDRFEWSLEKATELGVNEIVPLAAARSEKSLVAAARKRAERWRKILLESAQQSRRLRPPELVETIAPVKYFATLPAHHMACKTAEGSEVRLLFSERPTAASLKQWLQGCAAQECIFAIGPEGGWTDEEFSLAAGAGFQEASLGGNILRTETAVVAALAAVKFALEE